MKRGRFITLEGIDGAGKSTHLAWIEHQLQQQGIRVRTTREPGGTTIGERLRAMLLQPEERLNPETETLLMFAARREHLDRVILPALDEGSWVLCDRFTDATFAYQCGGSGVAWSKVAQLEQWVHPDVQPDLTLFFDVDPQVGLERTRRIKEPDRFEREEGGFYANVRAAYLRRAAENPHRIRCIDAGLPLLEVQQILARVMAEQ